MMMSNINRFAMPKPQVGNPTPVKAGRASVQQPTGFRPGVSRPEPLDIPAANTTRPRTAAFPANQQGPWSTSPARSRLRGDVQNFEPAAANKMKLLNADSELDYAPVIPIRPATDQAPKVISQPSALEGPEFTTDGDPNLYQGRYVLLENIPPEWLDLMPPSPRGEDPNRPTYRRRYLQALNDVGLVNRIIAEVAVLNDCADGNRKGEVFLWFDDLRDAAAAPDLFATALSTVHARFISCHRYFGNDTNNKAAQRISKFDGQVWFTAEFLGSLALFDHNEARNQIRKFAQAFGEVRTFALDLSAKGPFLRFRVEYFSLRAATAAVAYSSNGKVNNLGNLAVTTSDYAPNRYVRYKHPNAPGPDPDALEDVDGELVDDLEGMQISATGRTAHANGQPVPGSQLAHYTHARFDTSPHAQSQSAFPQFPGNGSGHGNPAVPHRNGKIMQIGTHHGSPSKKPEDPQHLVDLGRIVRGGDVRTTIMIRNVPKRVGQKELLELLDSNGLRGYYDFVYLRIDFTNGCNVGYSFVNFTAPEHIITFFQRVVGRPFPGYYREKSIAASYATIQGQDCLVAKFRNSSVMLEVDTYRPKVFFTFINLEYGEIPEGLKPGDEMPFPPSDNYYKLVRSTQNAGTMGLFNRQQQDGRNDRRRVSAYDRGTPRAIAEEQQSAMQTTQTQRGIQGHSQQVQRHPQRFGPPSPQQFSGPSEFAPAQQFAGPSQFAPAQQFSDPSPFTPPQQIGAVASVWLPRVVPSAYLDGTDDQGVDDFDSEQS
ncbi:hypothetical protein H2203_002376 [Taxawa tesnikishii (nom. ined.)]|nr:hypothetical protein H2203_002376 [Dothideales sp. JES 119]